MKVKKMVTFVGIAILISACSSEGLQSDKTKPPVGGGDGCSDCGCGNAMAVAKCVFFLPTPPESLPPELLPPESLPPEPQVGAKPLPKGIKIDGPTTVPVKMGGSQDATVFVGFGSISQNDSVTFACEQEFDVSETSLDKTIISVSKSLKSHVLTYQKAAFDSGNHGYILSFINVSNDMNCTVSATSDDGGNVDNLAYIVHPTPNNVPLYIQPMVDPGQSIVSEIQVLPGTANTIGIGGPFGSVLIHSDVGLEQVSFACALPTVSVVPSKPFSKWPQSWGMQYHLNYLFKLTVSVENGTPAVDTSCAITATDVLGQIKIWRVVIHTS